MRFRRRCAVFAVLCLGAVSVVTTGAAGAAKPVRVEATFDPDAALGSATAIEIALRLDPRRLTRAPLTELRFAYPRNLGLATSGLGLATCTRPATDFAKVLISATGLGGCSPNAVMGIGTALALVRLTDGQVIPEYASVTLLSGRLEHGRLGLVVYVDGQHPFGAKLAFAGDVRGARAPYGGQVTMRMPVIPGLEELATVSLVEMRITIGSHRIRYYERHGGRKVFYHPEGIQLPASCPARGFRFKAEIGFADGTHRIARSTTPCPSAVAVPAPGR